jgi:AraC-like DNA-binding protein
MEPFSDVEVLWISRFDYEQHWFLPSHAHEDYYQLIYLADGQALFELDGVPAAAAAPSVLFIPPENVHGIREITASRLVTLDVKFTIRSSELERLCRSLPEISVPPDTAVRDLLELIREQGLQKPRYYQLQCRLYLGQLLLTLLQYSSSGAESHRCSPQGPHQADVPVLPRRTSLSPLTEAVLEHLERSYAGPVCAASLEQHFSYSYRHISTVFSRDMGMTPMAFRERLRIARARELLSYTRFELKQISDMTGFQDVHQFTRSFKKREGMPPGQWRELLLGQVRQDICIRPDFVNELRIEEAEN